VVLERHNGGRRSSEVLQSAFDVELDPLQVGIGIGHVVAEIPGEFADDGCAGSEGIAREAAVLCCEAPAPRGAQVFGLLELHEDKVVSVAAAAELGGDGKKAGRCGMTVAPVDADALRLERHPLRKGRGRQPAVIGHGLPELLARDGRDATSQAMLRTVLVGQADPDSRKSPLPTERQIVARAGHVIGVVVQAAIDGAPETGVPVLVESEVVPVRELQQGAMGVGLKAEAERNIEVLRAEIEAADNQTGGFQSNTNKAAAQPGNK
jgi:hypothetical protein